MAKMNSWWTETNRWETDVPAVQNGSNTVQMVIAKFWTDAVNVQMALEKFRTDDASILNGTGKISNGWHKPFKGWTKNFKRVMPAVQTANEIRIISNGWY